MPTTAIIVQQRLGNTRLPCKGRLMLPNGRSVTEEVLHRCKQVNGYGRVILAVPDGGDDDVWVDESIRVGVDLFRGPELDVLKRYRLAADAYHVDVVLRVTADCPLLNPVECERVLDMVLSGEHDFAANSGPGSFSLGWSCEAFTTDLLRQADDTSTDPLAREHVGHGPRSLAKAPAYIVIPEAGSDLRPSLDTKDDYLAVLWAFQHQMREAAQGGMHPDWYEYLSERGAA
jgi:spore coat polysaccharide biosynthesis protein SpsF